MNKATQKADRFEKMPVIHAHAAGIDVGSRSHFVAIGQNKEDVREFGVYTHQLHELCQHLLDSAITTVALESTGSYWQPLFVMLEQYGLDPILVNGKFTKNVKGRKTDVQDCQWIQKLHAMGMLEGSFIPDLFTQTVRQYYRHRQYLVQRSAGLINKMQKALRLINIRLDNVLRDVMGRSGRDIIEAILAGQRDVKVLANLAQPTVKTPTAQIEQALSGQWREEYIFELRHCYELYHYYHKMIDECDSRVQQLLRDEIARKQREEEVAKVEAMKIKKKKARKNEARIDVQRLAAELSGGVDVSAIEGVGLGLVLCLMCEVGVELKDFASAKQFASWLRLSPDIKKSGGRVMSNKTPKAKNRLAQALKQSANAIGNMKQGGYLVHFFKRIERRRERGVAIVATARKLAVIIWNMLVKKVAYKPVVPAEYLNKIRHNQLKHIQRKIRQLNIHEDEIVFPTS